MAFGKRSGALQTSTVRSGPAGVQGPRERCEKLHEQMMQLLLAAQGIADAVRGERSLAMPVIAGDLDAAAGPIIMQGLEEHFIARGQRGVEHVIFAYAHPSDEKSVDPNTQFHLQQLFGQALAFNLFCQRAHLDEALIVALQSPDVPRVVDLLLVRSAFFAAYFDNMLAAVPGDTGLALERSLVSQKANLASYLLRAQDKMLAPQTIDSLIPLKGWPFVGVEMLVPPHEGDYFINGVYFPAEHARLLLKGNPGSGLEAQAVA